MSWCKRVTVFSVILGAVLGLCGCSKESLTFDSSILLLEPGTFEIRTNNVDKTIDVMSSNDVIVAVNGVVLTKGVFDRILLIKADSLAQKKGNSIESSQKELEHYRQNYPKTFVAQRLLVDNAFQLGVVTTNEVLNYAANRCAAAAKSSKNTPDRFLRGLGAAKKHFLYELCVRYIMDKLIHEKIPPVQEVDDGFLRAVKGQISVDNSLARQTNELIRAGMEKMRSDIVSGLIPTSRLENVFSERGKGFWGTFELSDFDHPAVQAAVADLAVNEYSRVVEDDDGFHIIKLLGVVPAERNEAGHVVQNERRVVSHFYVEKLPLLIEQSDVALSADLKNQMQLMAVDRYVSVLYTNGVNKVVYPHGDKLF